MKERELREHATCALCRNKIGYAGLPLFWRITIERFGLDRGAIERQMGLTMMLGGNAMLAGVMGANEEMANPVMEPVKLVVCERCAIEKDFPVAVMAEANA
jgi:hypothetical protein